MPIEHSGVQTQPELRGQRFTPPNTQRLSPHAISSGHAVRRARTAEGRTSQENPFVH